MRRSKRWHPSQESDELVYAVCDRFLLQLAKHWTMPIRTRATNEGLRQRWLLNGCEASGIARISAVSESIPCSGMAVRRNFLFLKPPRERELARMIARQYELGQEIEEEWGAFQVVNARGPEAARHVTAAGADLVHALICRLGERREGPVHVGLGAGFSAMMVAKRLAHRVYSDLKCPGLVLHALSAGGFRVDEAHKSPITYFSYFDDALPTVQCVRGLYAEAVVAHER